MGRAFLDPITGGSRRTFRLSGASFCSTASTKNCRSEIPASAARLLALVTRQHVHHNAASKWFAALAAGEAGLCRIVQLALIRLLNHRSVMGDDAISAGAAWRLIEELLHPLHGRGRAA